MILFWKKEKMHINICFKILEKYIGIVITYCKIIGGLSISVLSVSELFEFLIMNLHHF